MQTFIVTVLVIYGVHASTRDGMIFERLWKLCFNILNRFTKKPEWYLKPLFDCTPCMASVYGTISFFVYDAPGQLLMSDPHTYSYLFSWLVWVFSLTGFNYILNKIINRC